MHDFLSTAVGTLLSPLILFFVLGFAAALVRSDLEVPKDVTAALSLYLMLAIGFKGGEELVREGLSALLLITAGAGLVLGLILPVIAFVILTRLGRIDPVNAGAIASHYGSISVVTFVTAQGMLARLGLSHEGFMTAVMALMESPGVISGILLARLFSSRRTGDPAGGRWSGAVPPRTRAALRETLFGAAPTVLLGSLVIGAVTGEKGMSMMKPFIIEPFQGVLCLFLLDMGLTAGRRLGDFLQVGRFLGLFGIVVPLLGGGLGALTGTLIGLSVGGATLLAVLAASASYIAAPAAVRLALPQANPGLAITLSLGITFPFNIVFGIPLYHALASWLGR